MLTVELAVNQKPESRTLKKFIYVGNKNVLVGHFSRILMEMELRIICACSIFDSHVYMRVIKGDKRGAILRADAQA